MTNNLLHLTIGEELYSIEKHITYNLEDLVTSTPQRRYKSLVESSKALPLNGLLDTIGHVLV